LFYVIIGRCKLLSFTDPNFNLEICLFVSELLCSTNFRINIVNLYPENLKVSEFTIEYNYFYVTHFCILKIKLCISKIRRNIMGGVITEEILETYGKTTKRNKFSAIHQSTIYIVYCN